jgi:aspartokinase
MNNKVRKLDREEEKKIGFKKLFLFLIFLLLSSFVVILFFSFVMRILKPPIKASIKEGSKVTKIQVEVLNGCGEDGSAQTFTKYLRSKGFDVVSIGNADNFEYQETKIICRTTKKNYAKQVANALGIKKISIEPDSTRFVDVSVIVGKDYSKIKAFSDY